MEIKFTFDTEKNSLMKIPFLRNLRFELKCQVSALI